MFFRGSNPRPRTGITLVIVGSFVGAAANRLGRTHPEFPLYRDPGPSQTRTRCSGPESEPAAQKFSFSPENLLGSTTKQGGREGGREGGWVVV